MGYTIGDFAGGSPFNTGGSSAGIPGISGIIGNALGPNVNDYLKQLFSYLTGQNAVDKQYQYNSALQEDAQRFNADQAQIDRDFQKWMAEHQYQNAVNDLKAAGLNPWLAVSGLSGATPSGASASSSASNVSMGRTAAQNIGDIASSAVSAAIIAKIVLKMIK